MKRAAVLILILFLALSPACGREETVSPSPSPAASGTGGASYSGAAVDCTGLKAGDRFDWTLGLVSVDGGLVSGMWLIDYPEEYMKLVSCSADHEGSLTERINASWETGGAASDVPVFACNPEYMGGTGGSAFGEAGNMYALVIMYLSSFEHGGVNEPGEMVRLTFELTAVPGADALRTDADGRFLPINAEALESVAYDGRPHAAVSVSGGKLYFSH